MIAKYIASRVCQTVADMDDRTSPADWPEAMLVTGKELQSIVEAAVEAEAHALTPELSKILGTMCFQCIPFAQALRAAGHTIKSRAEDEQAAVLHWMLGHYATHGEDWRTAAAADMEAMRKAVIDEQTPAVPA